MTDGEQTPADSGSSGRQRKQAATVAALALAGGATVRAAARQAGVGERTLYSWQRKPAFVALVNRLRDRLASQAVGRLSRSMTSAADVLSRLLRSSDEATRLKAARAVIELALRSREAEELRRWVEDLETKLGGKR